MAKLKKVKKGDKKKISKLDGALENSLAQGADNDSYSLPTYSPSAVQLGSISTPPPEVTPPATPPTKKATYVKETIYPRKVMALFTEKQYQELDGLRKAKQKRDGETHTLNSVIRDAVANAVRSFESD